MWGFQTDRLAALGRPFQWLLLSDVLMLLSLMVGHVAIPWWVATQGGAAQLAVFSAAMAVVAFLALPLLSPLGDRLPKQRLITWGLWLMAAEGVVLALMAQRGFYSLVWLICLEVIAAVAMAAIMPASLSIAAELLAPEQLTEGLALQKSAQAIGRLMGPVLGGAVLAAAGTAVALWLHAALLLAAGLLAMRIGVRASAAVRSPGQWLADLRAGLRAKWRIPMERGWTFVSFGVMVFFGPGLTMLVPLKVQSLGLSAVWMGACEAGLSAGMLLGFLGGSMWVARRIGRFRASVGAILIEGLGLMAVGGVHQPVLLVACFAVLGACMATVNLVGQTHRMLAMPQAFRARMTAVNMMVMQVSAMLGPAVAGVALVHGELGGIDGVYGLFGLGLFVAGLGYQLVPGYKAFLSLPHAQAEGHYERYHPDLFR
jgi:MFS family permease